MSLIKLLLELILGDPDAVPESKRAAWGIYLVLLCLVLGLVSAVLRFGR